jgi:hypothetical protein
MSSKRQTIDSKFQISSDEEDPELLESNKELDKLNVMWKNLKEVKLILLFLISLIFQKGQKKLESSQCFNYFEQKLHKTQ